jgi:hypothetical protein
MQNEASEVLGMEDLNEQKLPEVPKDKPKNPEAEKELLKKMMYSPSTGDADPTITIDSTTDVPEDKTEKGKELLKMLEKGGKKSEKYQKQLLDKALKDPSSVEVETPQGWMTVRDAIEAGFNMETGQFDRPVIAKPNWEDEISKLDPREQETIRRLTQPGTRQAGPADSAVVGEEQGNPVLPEDQPLPETVVPGAEQGTPLALGGM